MNNQVPATSSVALPTLSVSKIQKITLAIAALAIVAVFGFAGVSYGDVRFSKPVVLLKGTVRAEQSGKVHSVKVSIRSAENKDEEITSSVSNSATGNYLVVLAPNTKYVVRLESAGCVTKEEEFKTPRINDVTVEVKKDFTVKTVSRKKDLGNLTK